MNLRYIKDALQQNAMYCFKLISSPLFLGRKIQRLKLKHTSAVPLLDWGLQPQHRAFISASKCGGGVWGEGSGEEKGGPVECKEGNKQTKK